MWGFALLPSGMAFLYLVIRYGANHIPQEVIDNFSKSKRRVVRFILSWIALPILVIRDGGKYFRENLVNSISESDWPLPRIWDVIVV